MAKDITRDRFRIHAETDAENMGHLLAALTKMGLENIGYELITETVTFGKNGPRQSHETSGNTFLREEFLPEREKFTSGEVVKFFKEAGRTPGSAYTSLREAIEAGLIVRVDSGQYRKSHKQLPAPQKELPLEASAKTAGVKPTNTRMAVTGLEEVLRFIKPRKKVTSAQLRELFRAQNRNDHSVSPILHKLVVQKKLKQTGEKGEYEVIHNGKSTPTPAEGTEAHG